MGEITVIKSLLISKFKHLFLALPNPWESFLKELSNIFNEFIWNGKPKIKQSILEKDYEEGGLKMTYIRAFMEALKTTWIRRLILKDGGWSEIIKTNIDMNKVYHCGKHYFENISRTCKNNFWKETFMAFSKLISSHNVDI